MAYYNDCTRGKERGGICVQVEALVPIRVQRSFADGGGLCLFAIDGGYGEWIGESYRRLGLPCQRITMTGSNVLKTSLLYRPSAAMTVPGMLVYSV
jgi:hypothetical protein